MSLNSFELLRKIGKCIANSFTFFPGEGAYSSVYHVRRYEDNQTYALKKVKLGKLSDKEKQNALNEVRILASITHPCIIGYKEVFLDEESLW
jgi:NIMA (never in mitosis gene a)-related kinase 1/4/5